MSLPSSEANGVFTHIYPISELGLQETVIATETPTSDAFSTGAPATIILISRLSSGSGTIKIDRHSTAANANFGSPDVTLNILGTARQVAVLNTTPAELFVSIQQSTTVNFVHDELAVFVMYELEDGEEWFNIRSGANAVANHTVGDGSGVVDMATS